MGRNDANAWGLHDIFGSVNEWVQGWHGDYPGFRVTDSQGFRFGSERMHMGGNWWYYTEGTRASSRASSSPDKAGGVMGFRLRILP